MRHIGDQQQAALTAPFDLFELRLVHLDLLCAQAVRFLDRSGVNALLLRAPNLLRSFVLLSFQPFDLRQQTATGRFEFGELVQLGAEVDTAVLERRAHAFEVVAKNHRVEHSGDCTFAEDRSLKGHSVPEHWTKIGCCLFERNNEWHAFAKR